MTSEKKICPRCKGSKTIAGSCECNAEWRGVDKDEAFDDCICEPDTKCPECNGTGYIQ